MPNAIFQMSLAFVFLVCFFKTYSSVSNNSTGTIIYFGKKIGPLPTLLLDTLRLLILDFLFHYVLYTYVTALDTYIEAILFTYIMGKIDLREI